jgi:hypothetical protein
MFLCSALAVMYPMWQTEIAINEATIRHIQNQVRNIRQIIPSEPHGPETKQSKSESKL